MIFSTPMNRRRILTLVPLAAAAAATRAWGKALDSSIVTAAGYTISVQCWSLKKFSLFEAIEKSAQAGAQGVEIFAGQILSPEHKNVKVGHDMPAEMITAMQEHAKKHKIAIVNFGVVAIPNNAEQARPYFEFAKTLGLYGITTESIGSIDVLEKLAKEYDIKVCFHNHPKPTALWNPDTIMKAIEGRDANLGFCADLGHWASSGLNPLDVIKKIAPRVHAFHMKDRTSITGPTHDEIFGKGIIDLTAILDEVRKHGFKGNVTIEYEHHWDNNVPDITDCVNYLRDYAKKKA
jgi:sugar phosphate isomerase/epimerase